MTELIPDEATAIDVAERFLHQGFEEFFEAVGGYDAYFSNHEKPRKVYETQEVPCGWVCEWNGGIDSVPLMVNRWTGEPTYLDKIPYSQPNLDVVVRDYISGLPPEQQEACKQRQHLEIKEPIQFYPPFLDLGSVDTFAEIPETRIELVYDVDFLTGNGVAPPPVLKQRNPTIRTIELLNDTADSGNRRRATYRILFDEEEIGVWFGRAVNRITIFEPGKEESESNLRDYWLRTEGKIEDLSSQWVGFRRILNNAAE